MIDTRPFKPEDNKGGTITQQLTAEETSSAYINPLPTDAPGIITLEPGTGNEETIYFRSKDTEAGTINGLIRDFTMLNSGSGRLHEQGADWEILQSAVFVRNLVDIIEEGFIKEQQAIVRTDDDTFTVQGNKAITYQTGRLLRFNDDSDEIKNTLSSSYNSGTGLTTVVIDGTLPNPLTAVEYGVQPKTAAYLTILSDYLSSADILDEDDMASNDPDKAPSQQSVKAYVDTPRVVALTDGATPALDASLGNIFTLSAEGNRTIAVPSNPTDGQKIIIIHHASGGARTLALNSGTGGFLFGTDVSDLGGATGSGKRDLIGCVYNSALNKWLVVAVVKGFS